MDNYNTQEGSYTNPEQPSYTSQDSNNYRPQLPMHKPDSNLVWAILCTVLCCMPFGIVSIVYAAKVDSLWYAGRQQEALDAANSAKKWALWGAIISIVGGILYLMFYVVIFGAAFTLPTIMNS